MVHHMVVRSKFKATKQTKTRTTLKMAAATPSRPTASLCFYLLRIPSSLLYIAHTISDSISSLFRLISYLHSLSPRRRLRHHTRRHLLQRVKGVNGGVVPVAPHDGHAILALTIISGKKGMHFHETKSTKSGHPQVHTFTSNRSGVTSSGIAAALGICGWRE